MKYTLTISLRALPFLPHTHTHTAAAVYFTVSLRKVLGGGGDVKFGNKSNLISDAMWKLIYLRFSFRKEYRVRNSDGNEKKNKLQHLNLASVNFSSPKNASAYLNLCR